MADRVKIKKKDPKQDEKEERQIRISHHLNDKMALNCKEIT